MGYRCGLEAIKKRIQSGWTSVSESCIDDTSDIQRDLIFVGTRHDLHSDR
jgi:hypothetical protein